MKPDRSNYEIWLIDWLDGNLDEIRTEQLMAFLEENPDLREEADSLLLTRLVPENKGSLAKEPLKRTPSELEHYQIEYLSVAYLENDLSDEQIKDLKENISVNQENRKLFETIQRTKLIPLDFRYKNKSRLRKKTRTERILRLSVIGLSAAATVAVIVISFIAMPRILSTNNEGIAANSFNDTIFLRPGAVITYEEDLAYEKPYQSEASDESASTRISFSDPLEVTNQLVALMPVDSSAFTGRSPEFLISMVPVFANVEINKKLNNTSLIASNIVIKEPLYNDSERSRLRRFIASAFREKILKDEKFNDAPLKPYEIAEAGIDGLNKLLGWEMALVKTIDEEGEPKSFYFSSRVLKFNAPIKKSNAVL